MQQITINKEQFQALSYVACALVAGEGFTLEQATDTVFEYHERNK